MKSRIKTTSLATNDLKRVFFQSKLTRIHSFGIPLSVLLSDRLSDKVFELFLHFVVLGQLPFYCLFDMEAQLTGCFAMKMSTALVLAHVSLDFELI
jgi:hypothetical protein